MKIALRVFIATALLAAIVLLSKVAGDEHYWESVGLVLLTFCVMALWNLLMREEYSEKVYAKLDSNREKLDLIKNLVLNQRKVEPHDSAEYDAGQIGSSKNE
jgi:hypothetical protein